MKQISYIVSLGTACQSAKLLQNHNMRYCSFPFDWIFSNPLIVTSCLKDNFKTFLDPNTHKKVEMKKRSDNIIYHSMLHNKIYTFDVPVTRNHIMYMHRDITVLDDLKYFERCVLRFNKFLTKSENKLFLIINRNQSDDICPQIQTDINELYNVLCEKSVNVHILFVQHVKKHMNSPFYIVQSKEYPIYITYLTLYIDDQIFGKSRVFSKLENDKILCNKIQELYDFELKNDITV